MKSIVAAISLATIVAIPAHAGKYDRSYEIEVSHNDELFIINGEKYEAKTYCFNMEKGDRVVFIEGSALGVCVSAKIVNTRTNRVCEVWCE